MPKAFRQQSEKSMKYVNLKNAGLISDALCGLLLGTAVLAAFLPVFAQSASLTECFLLMLASMTVIVLLSRKTWLFPLVISVASALFLLTALLFGQLGATIDYLRGLFVWFFQRFPDTLPYSQDLGIYLIRILISFPVAVILFLYFRRLFVFFLLPPSVICLIIWMYITKSTDSLPVLAILLFVLFVSLAKLRGRQSARNLPDNEKTSGLYNSISAVMLMPVIIAVAIFFGPKVDGDWKSVKLVQTVEDISALLDLGSNTSSSGGSFDLAMSGFSPLGNRLGGNVILNHDIVMRITTDTPARLTGAIFDTYDGYRWYDSHELDKYRFAGILLQGKRSDAFALDLPKGDKEIQALYSELITQSTMKVNSSIFGRTIFFAGKPQTFSDLFFDESLIFFNQQGEIYITGNSMGNMTYTIETNLFDRGTANFDANMFALEDMTKQTSDEQYTAIRSIYLQLPDNLPDSVYQKSVEITSGSNSPYEKAIAIERWLAENCTYTLSPGNPPEGVDFVSNFLETKEGYCVYFASAMTILARCADLPARYVTGFSLKRGVDSDGTPLGANVYVATNSSAHAWTEIYFEGIGWISFDATGWNFSNTATTGESNSGSNETDFAFLTPEPLSNLDTSEAENQLNFRGFLSPVIAFSAVAILLSAMLLFTLVRFCYLQATAEKRFRRLTRKFPDTVDRMDACYAWIFRQLAYLGFSTEEGETLSSFARKIDNVRSDTFVSAAFQPVIEARFALKNPSEDDIRKMCFFSADLEKSMLKKRGTIDYIWRRILLNR